MVTIKRKYCNLHGWTPHSLEILASPEMESGEGTFICYQIGWVCCRCDPPRELSVGKRILAKLRGFKLHKSITAKAYLAMKSKQETI